MCLGTGNPLDNYHINMNYNQIKELYKDDYRLITYIDDNRGITTDKCVGKEIESIIKAGVRVYKSSCGCFLCDAYCIIDSRDKYIIENLGYKTFKSTINKYNDNNFYLQIELKTADKFENIKSDKLKELIMEIYHNNIQLLNLEKEKRELECKKSILYNKAYKEGKK